MRTVQSFIYLFIFFSCSQNDEIMSYSGNIMTLGVQLTAPTPDSTKYHNDLIHPCVRYIPEGFAGHKWWMVATPYYKGNNKIENPILFCGDSREGELPPLIWTETCVVEDTPSVGYNADGNIYYDGTKLWVLWHENGTESCTANNAARCTFGVSTIDGVNFTNKRLFTTVESATEDNEMCPTVIMFNGKLRLYACYHQFTPVRIPKGLAIWDINNNDLDNNSFKLTKIVNPIYPSGFDFWHFDLFEFKEKLYCVVSNEVADEILLGYSDDGENFQFYSTPLLSTSVCSASYLYKPSAMVLNDIFYLWYPVRTPNGNRLYMSEMNFNEMNFSGK